MKTKVVHCKIEPYDIYIGRGSKWGNPYSHKTGTKAKYIVASREESLDKYREYLMNNPKLLEDLYELVGKTLGCWCKVKNDPDRACHGDILAELADNIKERE